MSSHSGDDVQKTLSAFETTLDWMKADSLI